MKFATIILNSECLTLDAENLQFMLMYRFQIIEKNCYSKCFLKKKQAIIHKNS